MRMQSSICYWHTACTSCFYNSQYHTSYGWLHQLPMNKAPHVGLNIGTTVGIAVVTTAVVIFIAGVLTGVLFYHCISNHRSQSSKLQSSSHQQQQHVISASNQREQTSPEYAEVMELHENMAYRPTSRANAAYPPVQQWFAATITNRPSW